MNYEGQLLVQQHRSLVLEPGNVNAADSAYARRLGLSQTSKTMQKVQAHDDESSASGSGVADLNSLDNGTDTLGRQIMQHERDRRRLQSATQGDQQPLLKARARPRLSELVRRREREENLASEQSHGRAASFGSNESDPPLNVPRDWGVRARSQRGWMRKIREPSEASIRYSEDDAGNPGSKADDLASGRQRGSGNRNDIWSEEENGFLPSMENTPPSMRRSRPNKQRQSLPQANATLRHIIDSEDQDFSDISLLASTPAATKSSHRPNDLAKELNDVDGYDVLASRHDSLANRSKDEDVRLGKNRELTTTSRKQDGAPHLYYDPRPATAPHHVNRTDRHKMGSLGNKENIPLREDDPSLPKEKQTTTIADRTARAVTFKQHQRPGPARHNSLHLLQRLATSLSPSPGKSSSDAASDVARGIKHESQDQGAQDGAIASDVTKPDQMTRRPRRRFQGMRLERHESNGQTNNGGPRNQSRNDLFDKISIPASKEQTSAEKTPVVAGAWVDTPGQPRDARSLQSSNAAATHSKDAVSGNEDRPATAPARDSGASGDSRRAKSALEDILREARKDPNGPFGDATMQSLEDIVHPNVDATDSISNFDSVPADGAKNAPDMHADGLLTQAEKDRRQEDLAIEAMNKHLRAARTSIKDADRGLRRVENRWESSSHAEEVPHAVAPSKANMRETTKVDENWKTVCEHCGGSYQSIWTGLWTEFRSNFYFYDRTARLGIRLTWLGTLGLIWLLYNLIENLLCLQYCHPLYASKMQGYGVDPDAPRYPFVIPTLLFKPLRPFWKPAAESLHASFLAVFHMVFGEPPEEREPLFMQPGFRFTPDMVRWDAVGPLHRSSQSWSSGWKGKAASTAAAAAARVTRSFVDAVDSMDYLGERMNDDEWL